MERNKKKVVPIVIVYNNKRKVLIKQTFKTLKENTEYPYELFTEEHKGDNLDYLKIKNKLINSIPYDWDLIVVSDDDVYFTKGWLKMMIKALKENLDVWILAAIRWYSHKHLERRKDITITEIVGGGTWLMTRQTWKKCGPYKIDVRKTYIMAEKIQKNGGKMAFLNDQTKVVHCGITSLIDKKERVKKGKEYIKKLAEVVGAKTL